MRLVRPRPFTAGEADPWAVLPDSIDASTAFARTDNHDLSRSRPDPYQRGQEMQGLEPRPGAHIDKLPDVRS